jgi:hypothetical protein
MSGHPMAAITMAMRRKIPQSILSARRAFWYHVMPEAILTLLFKETKNI